MNTSVDDRHVAFLENGSSQCDRAHALHHYRATRIPIIAHILMSAITLGCFFVYFRMKSTRRAIAIFGKDLKVIVIIGFSFYVIGASNAFILYCYKLYVALVENGVSCLMAFQYFSSISPFAYSLFHISLFVERLVVTFLKPSRSVLNIFGGFLAVILFVYPYYHFYDTTVLPVESFDDRVYCDSPIIVTTRVSSSAVRSTLFMLACDFMVTIGDFLLLIFNRYQSRKFYTRVASYNLNRSYELRELRISIKLIFPFSVCHSLGYTLQLATFTYYLTIVHSLGPLDEIYWKEWVNFMRTFSIFIIAASQCLYFQVNREKTAEWFSNEDQTETYFNQFNRMLS
ncbi:hypothetical protein M3Y95_01110500 [Aphelenchoides besseyi]|nr:hypothetical protein M3Y95_01110500 [Aphelenchoides besseyi]